ncbi:Crp/Fnr family transcriptional regulator (plasmid) [Cupriavidus pinatubonensis]|uniref:Crp/Fnr family transcriptional regulator n=1 Tax=Cupriavidus pinatubonensis TaxID=248026 RepID=UPI001C72B077|nr:Crp/Fnr family transcriptional regulator [Cupriavidus pinatubonensis]QYY33661.1 Crp/Fnr family transcriptional regulator [Cupriavidus pinatubonensis]
MNPALSLQQSTLLSAAPEQACAAPDLLAMLQPVSKAAVMALGRQRDYDVGELLFRQGDAHDGIFLIESGLVKSYYVSEDGRELTLGFWAKGNYVGAPQVFGGDQHAWSSVAVAYTRCLVLPGPELRILCGKHADLALALIDALVHKSQCYCALLQLLSTHSMRVRLARLLAMLAARDDGAIRGFSHSELASMIGSTRQWVSLSLARFEDTGILARRPDGGYQVMDHAALAAVR